MEDAYALSPMDAVVFDVDPAEEHKTICQRCQILRAFLDLIKILLQILISIISQFELYLICLKYFPYKKIL